MQNSLQSDQSILCRECGQPMAVHVQRYPAMLVYLAELQTAFPTLTMADLRGGR